MNKAIKMHRHLKKIKSILFQFKQKMIIDSFAIGSKLG